MRGEIVLGILKWYGCVEYEFMFECQIHGKYFETNFILSVLYQPPGICSNMT
jgi:hypothetical protein